MSLGWTLHSQPWGSDTWGRERGILHPPALSQHSDAHGRQHSQGLRLSPFYAAEIGPPFIRLAGKLGVTHLSDCLWGKHKEEKLFLAEKVPPLSVPKGCFVLRREYGIFQQAGSPHFGESPSRLGTPIDGEPFTRPTDGW